MEKIRIDLSLEKNTGLFIPYTHYSITSDVSLETVSIKNIHSESSDAPQICGELYNLLPDRFKQTNRIAFKKWYVS